MKKAIFFLLFFSTFSLSLSAQINSNLATKEMPPDFKSDGCSHFPNGKYLDCCVEHDKAYYFGGSYSARRRADNKLFSCVAEKKGLYPKLVAPIMWVGVRVFGTSILPTDFRWGFGKKKVKSDSQKDEPKKKKSKSLIPAKSNK